MISNDRCNSKTRFEEAAGERETKRGRGGGGGGRTGGDDRSIDKMGVRVELRGREARRGRGARMGVKRFRACRFFPGR